MTQDKKHTLSFSPVHSIWIKLFCCYTIPMLLFLIIWLLHFVASSHNEKLSDLLNYREALNTELLTIFNDNAAALSQQSYVVYGDADKLKIIFEGPTQKGYYEAMNHFKQTLTNFLSFTQQIDGIAFFNPEGDPIFLLDTRDSYFVPHNITNDKWYLDATAAGSHHLIAASLPFSNNPSMTMAVSKVIYISDEINESLGTMVCFSYIDNFVKKIEDICITAGEQFQLIDQSGNVIYSSFTKEQLPVLLAEKDDYSLVSLDEINMIQTSVSSSRYGWSIVVYTPYESSSLLDTMLSNSTMLTFLAIILASLVVSSLISISVTKPISKLMASFKEVSKGNFKAKVSIGGKDELAQIGNAYNQMLDKIQNLTKEKYELKLGITQSRLEALQSRINPHFLFNTLNSIKAVNYQGESEKVSKMIQSLSDLMRYSLGKGIYLVPFSEELNTVQKYLYLQEYRFGDRYSVEYDIENEVSNMQIPRLTIQPLVENAIKHGLEPLSGQGRLILTAKLIGEKIHIYISNNGVRIPPEKLQKLQKQLASLSDVSDFSYERVGLLNVAYRLALHYPEQSIMEISSTEHFTTIKLVIPAIAYAPKSQ